MFTLQTLHLGAAPQACVRGIDIETCRQCGGRPHVIASIAQPALIERILGHLGRAAGHPSRAPRGRSRLI